MRLAADPSARRQGLEQRPQRYAWSAAGRGLMTGVS
jgi:hypothetical protein